MVGYPDDRLGQKVAACVAATEQTDLNWLEAGRVPGATATQRSMATRALLDLSLAVRPDGAVVAGWEGATEGWEYTWPRDSCWVAVALSDTVDALLVVDLDADAAATTARARAARNDPAPPRQ